MVYNRKQPRTEAEKDKLSETCFPGRYSSDKPCPKCGGTSRYERSGLCVACSQEHNRTKYDTGMYDIAEEKTTDGRTKLVIAPKGGDGEEWRRVAASGKTLRQRRYAIEAELELARIEKRYRGYDE